jgi:hypothetical protein
MQILLLFFVICLQVNELFRLLRFDFVPLL